MERPTRAKIESLAAEVVILQGDNAALRARVARLEEALTPSAETELAMIGKFHFRPAALCCDHEGNIISVDVPWHTIKAIMKAIERRALEEK